MRVASSTSSSQSALVDKISFSEISVHVVVEIESEAGVLSPLSLQAPVAEFVFGRWRINEISSKSCCVFFSTVSQFSHNDPLELTAPSKSSSPDSWSGPPLVIED